jgi:hypothetical protein
VNPETISLITRPYQDVVDDILTAIVGGVTNEPIVYDLKSDLYPLARPARDIRGVTGDVDGAHFTFRKEADFLFNADRNALEWVKGGASPDDESIFYVDYYLQSQESYSPLTDLNVGSVTRTVSEAISREVAIVYQQVNEAYKSGFIDSATGKSLDYVVAILGVKRKTKEFARGLVTFFRTQGATGSVTIPEGTVLLASKGEARFETTEPRTLQRGQARIDVPVLAQADFKGTVGQVVSGQIDALLAAIEGIDRVINFDPTVLGAQAETDDELRIRAKAALRALGKATLPALFRVILEGRGKPVEAWDPNSSGDKRSDPGTVTVLVEAEPERMPQLAAAVNETRAAGVLATLIARYVYFKPRLLLTLSPGLPAAGKGKVIREVIQAIQSYTDGLSSGDDAQGAEILKAASGVADVAQVKIADVLTFRSDLGSPGAQALVDAILESLSALAADADAAAQRAAVSAAVSAEGPSSTPTGKRLPDRSLLQAADGSPATDEQVEKGEFKIAATLDGEKWWVVLDMDEADIALN